METSFSLIYFFLLYLNFYVKKLQTFVCVRACRGYSWLHAKDLVKDAYEIGER
jgi:hypothetical protein